MTPVPAPQPQSSNILLALESIRTKRKLWKKFKYCRSDLNKANYDRAKRESSIRVKVAKRDYEKSVAINMKDDSKIFWKFVQSKTKVKDQIQCLIDEGGEIYSDDREIAQQLNSFFKSVFTEENLANPPDFESRTNIEVTDIEINQETVEKLLSKIKETKSPGTDQIHPKFIKETAKNLAKPITEIFSKSMDEGTLPNDWKKANVTPLHKKGPKHKVSNYRPISLTSILCKTMERIVRDAIMEHMESNNLFTKHQHGFRKGHSCVTQLIEVIEEWTKELDSHNNIDAIYLDFQKAFDTVPHKRLITKLHGYGIRGKLLSWIENFLTDRKQRVILNGERIRLDRCI